MANTAGATFVTTRACGSMNALWRYAKSPPSRGAAVGDDLRGAQYLERQRLEVSEDRRVPSEGQQPPALHTIRPICGPSGVDHCRHVRQRGVEHHDPVRLRTFASTRPAQHANHAGRGESCVTRRDVAQRPDWRDLDHWVKRGIGLRALRQKRPLLIDGVAPTTTATVRRRPTAHSLFAETIRSIVDSAPSGSRCFARSSATISSGSPGSPHSTGRANAAVASRNAPRAERSPAAACAPTTRGLAPFRTHQAAAAAGYRRAVSSSDSTAPR